MAAEILNIEREDELVDYLRNAGHIGLEEKPSVCVLAGGVSNRTVLIRRSSTCNRGHGWIDEEPGEAWVIKQALAKLRVEADWFSDLERIHREATGLRWLETLAPPDAITPLVFEDHEHKLLAMRAVPEPHENWKEMLLAGRLERNHVEQFAILLGTIQRNAYERRGKIADVFDDRSFFESLRLEPYYGYAAEQVPEAADFLGSLVEETLARRDTLVHGDYSPKNVLVREGRLILLDHEVVHFGDPAFDFGFSITHLLSKAHHLPEMRSDFADATRLYWATYTKEASGCAWAEGIEKRAVRHTLGCLLARVAGRSPLEYLTDAQRERQLKAVCELAAKPPGSIRSLIGDFIENIGG